MGIINPSTGAAPTNRQAGVYAPPVNVTSSYGQNFGAQAVAPNRDPDRVRGDAGAIYTPPAQQYANFQQQMADAQRTQAEILARDYYRAQGNQEQDYYSQYRNLQSDLGFGQTDYNLGQEGLDLQRNLAQSQLGNRDAMIANLRQNYGLNDEDIANRLARSWLDQQTQEGILGQQQGQQRMQTQQELSSAQSRAIAGGGMFFPGHGVGQQQTTDLGNMAQEILRQNFRGVTEGGGLEREGIGIGGRKERLGLDRQILGEEQGKLGDQTKLSSLDLQRREMANQWAGTQAKNRQNQDQLMWLVKNLPEDTDAKVRALISKMAGG